MDDLLHINGPPESPLQMCLEAEFSACYVMIQQDFFLFNKNLGIIANSLFFSSDCCLDARARRIV